jgi:hypothetical protein
MINLFVQVSNAGDSESPRKSENLIASLSRERHVTIPKAILSVLSLIVLIVSLAHGTARAGLTDAQCERVRDLHGEYGKELCRKTLANPESGRLQFALAALWLDERVTEGNEKLRELHAAALAGNKEKDIPPTKVMTPLHASGVKWAMRGWLRVYYMFNDKSRFFPGRLAPDLQRMLEEMFWNYGCYKSTVERAQLKYIWFIQGSENHDMMDLSNAFLALQAIEDLREYKSRKLPDGHTAAEHVEAWTQYYKRYCKLRIKRGLFVEISPTYGKYFLPELVNIYEFAEDAGLQRQMEMLLHVTWADWAIDQLGGIRGGAKTRVYQGHYAQRGTSDSWSFLGRILTGKGDFFQTKHYEAQYVLAMTRYRLPDVVIDLALSYDERGDYVYRSRRPSKLGEPPESNLDEQGYWMDSGTTGHMLRYSYCTPDYIMGSWMLDPKLDYAAINTQNRWQGIIFATDMQARVFPQCVGLGNGKTYNQHLAVQHKNVMIVQKNRTKAKQTGGMRVWFTEDMKRRVKERDAWLFLQEGKAYLAITVPRPEQGVVTPAYRWEKNWLHLKNEYAPLVFVTSRTAQHASLGDFVAYVSQHRYSIRQGVLTYRFKDADSLDTQIKMSLENQDALPEVNGQGIRLAGQRAFDSPYLHSSPNGTVVTIEKGGREMVLDFKLDKQ